VLKILTGEIGFSHTKLAREVSLLLTYFRQSPQCPCWGFSLLRVLQRNREPTSGLEPLTWRPFTSARSWIAGFGSGLGSDQGRVVVSTAHLPPRPPRWCTSGVNSPPAQTPETISCTRIRPTYAKSKRVTDGTRTRVLQSKNPPNSVSRSCRTLHNRLL
jgi:hypothetical protein